MRNGLLFGACVLLTLVACGIHSPDLTPSTATDLIRRAPEFNRYAELIKVESLTRQRDSLADCCYYGFFTFRYRDSPADAVPIKAYADFRYWDVGWHFTEFDYGCDHRGLLGGATPSDCHIVQCYNPPPKSNAP